MTMRSMSVCYCKDVRIVVRIALDEEVVLVGLIGIGYQHSLSCPEGILKLLQNIPNFMAQRFLLPIKAL